MSGHAYMAAASPEISCWSKSLRNLPELSLQFVEEWAKQEAKVPKIVLIRGYSNFCEGYIFDVEGLYWRNVDFSKISVSFCLRYL